MESTIANFILSVRGPLLTVRQVDTLWVLRAGADPRAWKKKLDDRGNGTGDWQQGRPPLDVLLRLPGAFPPAASVLIDGCRRDLDLERGWSDEEREWRMGYPYHVVDEGDETDRICEGRVFQRGREKGTGPFPWAWIPGEGERRLRRVEPEAAEVGWYRERPMEPRDWKRIPPGGYCDEESRAPVAVTNEAFRKLRLAIRRTLLLRQGLPQWAGLFPDGAMEFVERHGFETRRWHLLNLWLRVPGGRELWDDIPALAWLAASSWLYKTKPVERPFRSLRTLVRKPRAHLLRWLDLPAGDGTLALLRSVKPSLMSPRFAHALCRVLRDEDKRRAWRNLPKAAGYAELSLLAYDSPISFPILRLINRGEGVGPPQRRQPAKDIFGDCLKMIRALRRDRELHPVLARVRSGERLIVFHDELVRDLGGVHRWGRLHDMGGVDPAPGGTLPPPPLPPPPWMFPMRTWKDLYDEGRLMRHCVAGYGPEVAQGTYGVYSVLHPSYGRATLGIRRNWEGTWQVAELRGKCNRDVPDQLRELVEEWLRQAIPAVPPKPPRGEASRPCPLPRPGENDPQIAAALQRFAEHLGAVAGEGEGDWEDEIPF